MITVSSVGFVVLAGVGFGAQTACTNDASVLGLDETTCDAIDNWAWGGLILVLILAGFGYGVLVPARLRESILLGLIVAVVVGAAVGMASVQPA